MTCSGMQERKTKFFRPSRAGGEQSEPSRELLIINGNTYSMIKYNADYRQLHNYF